MQHKSGTVTPSLFTLAALEAHSTKTSKAGEHLLLPAVQETLCVSPVFTTG